MPSHHFDVLRSKLSEVEFVDATDVFACARLLKSAEEIASFERGVELTDLAMEAIEREVRIGMPEYQRSAILHQAVLPEGDTLRLQFVGATPMSAPELIFHRQYPAQRPLVVGDVLLTEISAGWWGCSGQIQRPYASGCAPTPEYLRLFAGRAAARGVAGRAARGAGRQPGGDRQRRGGATAEASDGVCEDRVRSGRA